MQNKVLNSWRDPVILHHCNCGGAELHTAAQDSRPVRPEICFEDKHLSQLAFPLPHPFSAATAWRAQTQHARWRTFRQASMVGFNALNNPAEILGPDPASALVARRHLQPASTGFPECRESQYNIDTQGGEGKWGSGGKIKLHP